MWPLRPQVSFISRIDFRRWCRGVYVPEVHAKLISARHAEWKLRIFHHDVERLVRCEDVHQHAVYKNILIVASLPFYRHDRFIDAFLVLVGVSIPENACMRILASDGILASIQVCHDPQQDVLDFVETICSGMSPIQPSSNDLRDLGDP